MSCPQFEERIALNLEGDLPASEVAALERHLETCNDCRAFAKSLGESQAAVKTLRDEEPDRTVLQGIRREVMARAGAEKPPLLYAWRWRYALAVVVVLVAAGPFLFRPHKPGPAPAKMEQALSPARAVDTRPTVTRSMAPRPLARGPSRSLAPRPLELPQIEPVRIEPTRIEPPLKPDPLVVKLVTDDPNVVIVWLIDRNGDAL